ncbi:MAG TPA: hypothetical protein VLM38_01865 [Blastocatellia bacterium]|nr:hypothetical protein [Blastocatellia bacterium]
MFEQPAIKSEKDRSQTIMILSGVAVVAVVALIIIVTSFGRRPVQAEMARSGSPEFDGYAPLVAISNLDKRSGERMNIRYARILCTVQNTGDQVLTGLQLRAAVLGTGGQLIRDKVITPVPNTRDTLAPNQSMNIDVSIERVPDPSEIMDMTIEVHALKVK